jgi:hypothetical protein
MIYNFREVTLALCPKKLIQLAEDEIEKSAVDHQDSGHLQKQHELKFHNSTPSRSCN